MSAKDNSFNNLLNQFKDRNFDDFLKEEWEADRKA